MWASCAGGATWCVPPESPCNVLTLLWRAPAAHSWVCVQHMHPSWWHQVCVLCAFRVCVTALSDKSVLPVWCDGVCVRCLQKELPAIRPPCRVVVECGDWTGCTMGAECPFRQVCVCVLLDSGCLVGWWRLPCLARVEHSYCPSRVHMRNQFIRGAGCLCLPPDALLRLATPEGNAKQVPPPGSTAPGSLSVSFLCSVWLHMCVDVHACMSSGPEGCPPAPAGGVQDPGPRLGCPQLGWHQGGLGGLYHVGQNNGVEVSERSCTVAATDGTCTMLQATITVYSRCETSPHGWPVWHEVQQPRLCGCVLHVGSMYPRAFSAARPVVHGVRIGSGGLRC